MDAKSHWDGIYKTKGPAEVSWYESHLNRSLELFFRTGVDKNARVVDVGGGGSTFADDLLGHGFEHITVLDISSEAIEISKSRLDSRANRITWIEADITQVQLPENSYDVWHDRVLFHFLIRKRDRSKYITQLRRSLRPGGHAVIATFGLEGPLRCSGLDVIRYSPVSLSQELGGEFSLVESFSEDHVTPFDTTQEFLYCRFIRHTGVQSLP